ncbi:hypothetical protein [Methanolobus halotolerans]|uniref:hypothetical protein n=1 Tax=Methanolobus halotolerans TaxID=2052935 RepID=UPI001436CBBC|nr:hypothetical protein [Methanolobus halotolerans]
MKKTTCARCEEGLEIIDKYSHLLNPEKKIKTSDQQKINGLISKMSNVLNTSV